jgi:hypothetical protein
MAYQLESNQQAEVYEQVRLEKWQITPTQFFLRMRFHPTLLQGFTQKSQIIRKDATND